jgi:serine/threonine protein kinase
MGAGASKANAPKAEGTSKGAPLKKISPADKSSIDNDPLESTVRPASLTSKNVTTTKTNNKNTADRNNTNRNNMVTPVPPPGVPTGSTTSDNGNSSPSNNSRLAPQFVISMEDLEILQAVGEGGFCRVHKARFIRDKSTVAVKQLKGMDSPTKTTLESFKKEIALHSKIRHPHVIQFFGGCTKPPDMCLVTEFMFCSLQHALDNDPSAFHPQFEIETALCVALGLNHLHCLNIIHRDLKASNVLVDRNYCNPKIADFGLARVKLAQEESMTKGIGSPFAMAPEVFTSSTYTQAVDWYAFGVLLWQLVTKKHPYVGMKQMDIVKHVVQEDKRLPLPE